MQNERIALSAAEAAELIGISESSLYRIMKRSDCDFAFMIGKRRLISRPRLEAWIDRQAEEAAQL